MSLIDFLKSEEFSSEMISLASAGFSNTFCSTSENMSFKQSVRYTRLWHGDEEDEGEFRFKNTYACVINYLKRGLNIKVNTPVTLIDNSKGYEEYSSSSESSSDLGQSPVTSSADLTREMIRVTTVEGTEYLCRSIVVTSSPKVLLSNLMKFQPPLPSAKIAGLESLDMFRAMKIILKFKKRPWPKNLQGMIMSAKDCLVPEMWFRDVNPLPSSLLASNSYNHPDEAVCIASGFATAKYADRLLSLSEEEMYKTVLVQMDEVFSHLTSNHMSAHPSDEDEKPETLPSPSSVFIKAMYHDWKKYPYIGGGYSCARTGWNLDNCKAIAESICVGRSGGIFFAGEATNVTQPGGTAHAALETGVRAADEVSAYLDMYFD
jgi:hypothetical protein